MTDKQTIGLSAFAAAVLIASQSDAGRLGLAATALLLIPCMLALVWAGVDRRTRRRVKLDRQRRRGA